MRKPPTSKNRQIILQTPREPHSASTVVASKDASSILVSRHTMLGLLRSLAKHLFLMGEWSHKLNDYRHSMAKFVHHTASFMSGRRGPLVLIMLLYLFSVGLKFASAPWNAPLREDDYAYLLKSLEIAQGDLTPVRSQAIGTSLIFAPFFMLLHPASLSDAMIDARLLAIFASSLLLVPIYLFARVYVARRYAFIAALFAACYPVILPSQISFTSEVLFLPLVALSLALLARGDRKPFFYVYTGAVAGIAYWVRPNGIFLLGILLLVTFVAGVASWRISRYHLRYAVLSTVAFFVVSSPSLYLRYEAFGSAFDYGMNSKYFVDVYNQVWSDTDPAPTFRAFIHSHSVPALFKRFVIDGVGKPLFALVSGKSIDATGVIVPALVPLVLVGGWIALRRMYRDPTYATLIAPFVVWFIGLAPIYIVFPFSRHLWGLVPAVIVLAVIGLEQLMEHTSATTVHLTVAGIALTLVMPVVAARIVQQPAPDPAWASWIAANVRGTVAIVEGGDLIMQHVPDTRIGGREQMSFYAPVTGLAVLRPGNLPSVEAAIGYFTEKHINVVVVDQHARATRPYLAHIDDPTYRDWFRLVYRDDTSEWTGSVYSFVPQGS